MLDIYYKTHVKTMNEQDRWREDHRHLLNSLPSKFEQIKLFGWITDRNSIQTEEFYQYVTKEDSVDDIVEYLENHTYNTGIQVSQYHNTPYYVIKLTFTVDN